MDFKEPYLLAMCEQAPKLLQELQKHGRLDQHLQEKSREAHALLRQVLRGNENPSLSEQREAEESVRVSLIEFSDEYLKEPKKKLKPPADLVGLPNRGEGREPSEYAALMGDLFQQQNEGPKVANESQGNEENDVATNGAVGASGIERAVWRFARERFERLAQDLVAALQEHPASGIYGDDAEDEDGRPLKTLWDEFRYEVHFGPHDDVVDFAWESTLSPFSEAMISTISDAEKRLLFLATEHGSEFDLDSGELPPLADTHELIRELDSALRELAGKSRNDEEGEESEDEDEDEPEEMEC